MQTIAIVLAIAAAAHAAAPPKTITSFRDIEQRDWDHSRRSYHRRNFRENKDAIDEFNADPTHSYRKGLNEFSYMDPADFIALKCKTQVPTELMTTMDEAEIDVADLANGHYELAAELLQSVDYSSLMQPVMRQGACGACWSFSSMGLLEGLMTLRNTSLPTGAHFSPQYLIDCDANDSGCEGGWPATALRYLKSTTSDNKAPRIIDYPYIERKTSCNRYAPKLPLNITRVTEKFFKGNETALQAQVSANGPTIAVMFATGNLAAYESGVFSDSSCPVGPEMCNVVNHAVIVVGFGTDPVHGEYWKVKNSWGNTWGENGYFRIARNQGNMCSIGCWAVNAY
jgi:cathepsin L